MNLCDIGIHRWGKWTKAGTVDWYIIDSFRNEKLEFEALTQHRTCWNCGKTQSRRVK